MARGKAPDPKRRKTSHPHATYFTIARGGKEAGWKAGEIYGCYGHYAGNHKPCVFELTEGAFPCPYCAAKHECVYRAYVPCWDRDFALRYVLVNEDYFEAADCIPIGSQVVVSRGKTKHDPLIVRQESAITKLLPDRDPWNIPVNQLCVCLTLWKDEMLTSWFRVNKPNELLYVRKTEKAAPVEKFAKDPLVKLKEAEEKARKEDEDEQKRIGATMQRLLNPHLNGKAGVKKPT